MGFSLGGLISGAISGAGGAAAEIATGEIKKNQQMDLEKQMLQAREEMQLRVDEVTRDRGIRDIGRTADATAAAAPTVARGAAAAEVAGAKARLEGGLPGIKAEAETAEYNAKAGLRETQRGEKAKDVESDEAAKDAAKRAAYKALAADPKALAGMSAEARAKYIESSATAAAAELTRLEIGQRKKVIALMDQFTASKDPQEQARIREEIQTLTGKDPDNFIPLPIKDEMGNTVGYDVLDKKNGAVRPAGGKPAVPPGNRPPLSNFNGK